MISTMINQNYTAIWLNMVLLVLSFFQAYLKQIEVNVTLNKYCTPKTDSTKMLGLEDYFSFESWSLFR